MKTITRRQRAEIYLEAAKIISKRRYYACLTIMQVAEKILRCYDPEDHAFQKDFPEFMLLNPEERYNGARWWDRSIEGDNCRLLTLLFAYQIALNP